MNDNLDKMTKQSLTEKVIFVHTHEEDERVNHTDRKGQWFFIMRIKKESYKPK